MKSFLFSWFILVVALLLVGCSEMAAPAATEMAVVTHTVTITAPTATATLTPLPSATSVPTATALPPTRTPTATPTATITPSPTPTPFVWVEAVTAVPVGQAAINETNATAVVELARWGRGVIYDLAYSADSRYLSISAANGTYQHDLQNPTADAQLLDRDRPALLPPTGDLIVVGNEVRRVSDQTLLFTIPQNARLARFFLNGEILAVRDEWNIQLWDVAQGQLVHTVEEAFAVAFSVDGTRLAVLRHFATNFVIYEWPGLARLQSIEPVLVGDRLATQVPSSFAFAPDGQTVAVGWDGYESWQAAETVVQIRDLASGEIRHTFPHLEAWAYREDRTFFCDVGPFMVEGPGAPKPIYLAYSPDGQFLLAAYQDIHASTNRQYRVIHIYNAEDGSLAHTVTDGAYGAFAPDGRTLTTSTIHGEVQVWNFPDFSPNQTIGGYNGRIKRLQLSPDSRLIAVEYHNRTRLHQTADGATVADYLGGKVTFHPDGNTLAVGYENGRIEWRQLADNSLLNRFSGHAAAINDLVFLPAGPLASTAEDCTTTAWDVASGHQTMQFEPYTAPTERNEVGTMIIRSLLAGPADSLIGRGRGSKLAVWQLADGRLDKPLVSESALAILPTGEQIAILREQPLAYWPSASVSLFIRDPDVSMAFSADNTLLALGNGENFVDPQENGRIELRTGQSGEELYVLHPSGQRKTTAVAFTPDGRLLFSGGLDGLVRVWGVP